MTFFRPFGLVIAGLLFFAQNAHAHPGIGIVTDSQGAIYYTDLKQVWRIALDGTLTVAVPKVHTHELYLDRDDNLFGEHLWYEGEASDKWGHRVWRRAKDGKITDVIPSSPGFRTEYSFVRDARGNMYFVGPDENDADRRTAIMKRVPNGRVTLWVGGVGGHLDGKGAAARFRHLGWIVATPEGVVYAVDNNALRRVSRDGVVTTMTDEIEERPWWTIFLGRSHRIMGLCPDAMGNVFVTNPSVREIKKVSVAGTVSVFDETESPFIPTGVTVSSSGELYVLEYAGVRVRVKKIGKDGREKYFEAVSASAW